MSRLAFVAPLASLFFAACAPATSDPHHPGDFIGSFRVDAARKVNSCGEGALGSMPKWSFDVRLSRGEGELFWDNGVEVVPGTLEPDDKTFSFDSGIIVDMRDASSPPDLPPCSLARADHASGVIAADDATFTGELSYAFAPTQGSDCTDLVAGAAPIFAALPCGMSYTLSATRTSTTR
jgi:hypothetical protein